MIGIWSIDVSITANPFCREMSKIPQHVCYQCWRQKTRGGDRTDMKLRENAALLSGRLLRDDEVPIIYQDVFRFNRIGELINRTHLENLILIANKNPHCEFTLFTKRIDIVKPMRAYIPQNIRVIFANIFIDNPITIDQSGFDGVHNVVTPPYIAAHPLFRINCTQKCRLCMRCFGSGRGAGLINELKY